MSRIFINYRRQDSEGYVGRLYDTLLQYFAHSDLFMDVDSIKPGADFLVALEEAVANCDVLLAIIGPHWAGIVDEAGNRRLDNWNDFVRIEIASAIKQNKFVIPVLVGHAQMPSPDKLPDDLAPLVRRNAIEISHQRVAYDVERRASSIKEIGAAKPIASPPPKRQPANPQKEALFKTVRADLLNATTSPLYGVRTKNGHLPVVGEGNLDAKIMFIGESPGKTEAEQGRPFCGPSGDMLEELLGTIQLSRPDIFITNLILDHPGEKREPTPEEIAYYVPFVDRLVEIIRPAVIATLGRFAMQYMIKKLDLPEKHSTITQIHGKLIKTRLHYGEIYMIPLYHPAVLLYSMSQKELLKKDFAKLKLFL